MSNLSDKSSLDYIGRLVGELPEDTPSMAWRSALNERILKESVARKRRRFTLNVLRPTLGLAVAASLAVAFMARPSAVNPGLTATSGSIESVILEAHTVTTANLDAAGVGLDPQEMESYSHNTSSNADWIDIEAGLY